MKAVITNFGAILISLFVKDKKGNFQDVVLGYDSLEEYLDNHPMFGATVGRNVNRISNAKFELDGKTYLLDKNRGNHNIHSDKEHGFHKVIWDYEITGENSVCLSYLSCDMEQGFPGEVYIKMTYTLTETNGLILSYFATPNKRTILNVTNHTYFNLGENIFSTEFCIHAKSFTPVDEDIIPTGEIISPIDGQIVMIQDSLHAIGIQSEDGIEILIHVGLDTVELKGEGFVKKVNINDRVNKGQPIVCFDKEMIEEKGYNTITMMIVVNDERISKLEKGDQLDKPLIKVQYK